MAKNKHKITSYRATADEADWTPKNVGGSNSVLFWNMSLQDFDALAWSVISCYDPDRIILTDSVIRDFVRNYSMEPIAITKPVVYALISGTRVHYLISRDYKLYRISPTEFIRNINYWASKLCSEYDELRKVLGNDVFKKYLVHHYDIQRVLDDYAKLKLGD